MKAYVFVDQSSLIKFQRAEIHAMNAYNHKITGSSQVEIEVDLDRYVLDNNQLQLVVKRSEASDVGAEQNHDYKKCERCSTPFRPQTDKQLYCDCCCTILMGEDIEQHPISRP